MPETRKILIIDDNGEDRDSCRRYLQQDRTTNYIFHEEKTMEGGIRAALDGPVDAIMLDYSLPDGNGVRFLEFFAERGLANTLAVVMLTSTGDEMIAVQAMKFGAHDYLLKGKVTAETVRLAVRNAIYKSQTNQVLERQRGELQRLYDEAQVSNRRKDDLVTELQAAKEAAESANRAKDRFLATLSHELRTPLTPVLSIVSEVLDSDGLPHEVRETFEMIRRNIGLEARLIDDLLDLTRISRGKLVLELRPTDLNACIQGAADICRSDFSAKKTSLVLDLAAAKCTVLADNARLSQVIWNLLKNAVKFTPTGGEVSVSTRQLDDESVVVLVKDSGVGIPEERREKIFDAFDQGNSDLARRLGGLGLGLAISKALVLAHGGTIDVQSGGENEGSTFRIQLKLTKEVAQANSTPISSIPARAEGSPTYQILLVEDHEDSSRVLARALLRRGYQVRAAASVEEGFTAFMEGGVNLIVCDIGLPDGTGIDLMNRVSAIGQVPAIALSGFGMEHDLKRSEEAGFRAHLTKPVDFPRLLGTMERILQESNS